MKKTILSLILILGFVNTDLQAQDIRIGIHASPNISMIRTNMDFDSRSSKLKFNWGVRAERKSIDRNFSYFAGIDLSSKGGKLEVDGIDFDINGKYIEIPMGIKMATRPIGEFSYWLNVGLVPNFKISEDVTLNSNVADPGITDDYLSSLNASLLLGLGIQYELTEGTDLMGGIQFNNGFTNNIDNGSSDDKLSFNTLGLFIGVLF